MPRPGRIRTGKRDDRKRSNGMALKEGWRGRFFEDFAVVITFKRTPDLCK